MNTTLFFKRTLAHVIGAFYIFSMPSIAHALDNTTGKISQLDVTAGNNFAVRIHLAGNPTMCTGGPNWAYLNDTDSNYKVYVAVLLAAKLQGNNITVYSSPEGAYCHISYLAEE